MAPAVHVAGFAHYARQSQIPQEPPSCVTDCMATAQIGSCSSLTDFSCLCASPTYLDSVASCWGTSCNATEIQEGEVYSATACQSYGVTVPWAASNSSASTSNTTSAAPIDVTSAPLTTSRTFVHIQATMSSICTALILVALFLGFLACRNRLRRDREMTQDRTWTGVGATTAGDSKKSRFGRSQGAHSSIFSNSRNGATTVGSVGLTSANYAPASAQTVSFAPLASPTGTAGADAVAGARIGAQSPSRFTNRLTLGDIGQGEVWEMHAKSGSSDSASLDAKDDDFQADPESPTTTTGRRGDSEIELGSMVHLNKGAGPHAL